MTGTDQPTVVRNPKIKVKVKTAPQQTLASLGFTTARKPLTNPSSPAQVGNHWHVPKYMGDTGHLVGSRPIMYDEGMTIRIEVHTNKRSYTWIGPTRVTWEKGEKVISMEPKSDA